MSMCMEWNTIEYIIYTYVYVMCIFTFKTMYMIFFNRQSVNEYAWMCNGHKINRVEVAKIVTGC